MLLQKPISLHSLMTIITALKDKESKYYNLSFWNKETEVQKGCSSFRETPCPRRGLLYTVQRFFFSALYLDLGCFGRNNCHSVRLCASVVSDSLWPHGPQPTRLLCPRDFPGKNTGRGCHFLLQEIFLTQGLNPHLLRFFTTEPPGKPPAVIS